MDYSEGYFQFRQAPQQDAYFVQTLWLVSLLIICFDGRMSSEEAVKWGTECSLHEIHNLNNLEITGLG